MEQFVFTISNARAGAHLLRGLLVNAFDLDDLGEVFTPSQVISAQFRETASFDTFLRTRPDLIESVPFPYRAAVDAALDAFFEAQRRTHDARYLLADIKYGHLTCLTPAIYDLLAVPYLWQWMLDSGTPIIHLVRRNLLEQYASTMKSRITDEWVDYAPHASDEKHPKITLDTRALVPKLTEAYRQIQYVDGFLQNRPRSYLIYYEDLLEDGHLSKAVADVIAGQLGPYSTLPAPITRKISPALEDYVENYGAVADTLKGTPFESMLT